MDSEGPPAPVLDAKVIGNPAWKARQEFAIHDISIWWPYQSMCQALLRTLPESSAVIAANRKMQDDIAGILRDEQSMVCAVSERAFRLASNFGNWNNEEKIKNIREIEETFSYAADCMRKIGAEVAAAQIRALSYLQEAAIARASFMPLCAKEKREQDTRPPKKKHRESGTDGNLSHMPPQSQVDAGMEAAA